MKGAKTKPKGVQFFVDGLTVAALDCYVKNCDNELKVAQDIDGARFWKRERSKAQNQVEAMREALSNNEGDFYF